MESGGRRSPLSDPGSALALHGTIAALVGFLMALLWGLTGGGYFWPVWVWFGAAVVIALHAALAWALRVPVPDRRRRVLAVHAALSVVACGVLAMLWLLGGAGGIWPAVPVFSIVGIFACDIAFNVILDREASDERTQELTERVDELTRTRQGALELQSAELRRVERDLHDGAQSRLVALSMQLGRAEARLSDDPEAAALVRQARGEATEAIAELRDLARGIAPPILADRGLAEAVRSLGRRSSASVVVAAEIERRPPTVIEAAAYFVVAEALTNAAKHAPDAPVAVSLVTRDELLSITVRDEGPGGADPAGNGLTGLRHRVEAVDGGMIVTSPRGAGTLLEVDLPCGS